MEPGREQPKEEEALHFAKGEEANAICGRLGISSRPGVDYYEYRARKIIPETSAPGVPSDSLRHPPGQKDTLILEPKPYQLDLWRMRRCSPIASANSM